MRTASTFVLTYMVAAGVFSFLKLVGLADEQSWAQGLGGALVIAAVLAAIVYFRGRGDSPTT